MRTLVCGGRDFESKDAVWRGLDMFHGKHLISLVIHGNQRGVDTFAGMWARSHGIEELPFDATADFKKWGKRGGSVRNGRMLRDGKPDIVLAFPGGPGTRNMRTQAAFVGVRIIPVSSDGTPMLEGLRST